MTIGGTVRVHSLNRDCVAAARCSWGSLLFLQASALGGRWVRTRVDDRAAVSEKHSKYPA